MWRIPLHKHRARCKFLLKFTMRWDSLSETGSSYSGKTSFEKVFVAPLGQHRVLQLKISWVIIFVYLPEALLCFH